MAGADIKIVSPQYNSDLDIFMPITVEDINKAIIEQGPIDILYLTSPTYEGLCSNYKEIREAYPHMPFIVDEAHGAHFYFNKQMPKGAIPSGVDVVTNSVH